MKHTKVIEQEIKKLQASIPSLLDKGEIYGLYISKILAGNIINYLLLDLEKDFEEINIFLLAEETMRLLPEYVVLEKEIKVSLLETIFYNIKLSYEFKK